MTRLNRISAGLAEQAAQPHNYQIQQPSVDVFQVPQPASPVVPMPTADSCAMSLCAPPPPPTQ